MFDYDAELRGYHARLLDAVDIGESAQVLDIGCGTGQLTRAAARAAFGGRALGIDISEPMVAQARRLADLEGLRNLEFEVGDAQVHPLSAQHFTVAVSRFGTMFFADPSAAFANIAQALRPGATFTQLVWQDSNRQEWHTAIRQALTNERALTTKAIPVGRGAFSLANPAAVDILLTGAGFVDVQLTQVQQPVYYGADGADALLAIRSLGMIERLLPGMDDISTGHAVGRLQRMLDARDDDGVWFDSSAWLVTARRR